MKTYLLLALLFLAGFTVQAQKIINHTQCKIIVRPVCYDPQTCTFTQCAAAVVVPPGGSVPRPICPQCDPPRRQGYIVCYDAPSTGCNFCANIGTPGFPCAQFPVPGKLGPCERCGNVSISVSYVGADLVIQ